MGIVYFQVYPKIGDKTTWYKNVAPSETLIPDPAATAFAKTNKWYHF